MSSIADYEFVEHVAIGSTGVVWKARHRELNRLVAVKELSVALRRNSERLERFRAEAALLAELDDEHIVKVYDYIEDEAAAYIIQEWIAGETLEALLSRAGRLDPEQSVGVLRGGLLGLAAAHDRHVVHGDVSTANIILDAAGTSKMIDFGLAGAVGDTGRFGTPAFMSPEAASGNALLPASDVYSAAAVLFMLLSGTPPMPGPDVASVLRQHREAPAPQLHGHGPDLRETLHRAMAKDPLDRPPDARALLAELEEAAKRRFGAGWLSRAGVAALIGGGASEALVQAGAGAGAAAEAEPVVAEALDREPGRASGENAAATSAAEPRRHGRTLIASAGVLVLAAVAAGTAFAVSGGPAKHAAATIHASPSPAKTTAAPKPVVLIHPAAGATVIASARISTTFVVSGACSGQGGYTSYYRFTAARVPVTANALALRLAAVPGGDTINAPPVTVTCPGFTFQLTGSGTDRMLTSGTIGSEVRIVSTDLTNPPGLPPNVVPGRVYVEVSSVPQYTGKGLALGSCNASSGGQAVLRRPYPCLPANTTYRVSVPLAAAATTCVGQASVTVTPVDVSCHSTGALTLLIRTYAKQRNPVAATPAPSG